MEGDLDAELSELVLHSNLRGSQTPTIDTPLNEVRLPEEETRNIVPNMFPEGTCTECQKITLHGLLETHFGSIKKCWLGYDRDLPTNCPICELMFDSTHLGYKITGNIRLALSVNDHQPNIDVYTGRRIHEVRMLKYRQHGDFITEGQIRIYAEPGSYASNFVPYWRAPSFNLSETTFQKIARRIKNCGETHTRCRNLSAQFPELTPQCLPSRVIHVGSETRQPHLHIAQERQTSRYVALSHCWGNVPQLRTLKENIEQHKEEIVFESLSRTFQDAIRVTRRLGIEYIWVDSLCIVQDDEDDWLHESENMGSIYMNADITIAATSATDGNGGLDSVRPKSKWIEFPCDSTDEGKGHMWLTDASWSSQSDLNDAPLNLRGWVLQEKMLSRRIIHFASSQVYWECKEGIFGEECEDRIPFPKDATLKPSEFWSIVNAVSRIGTTPVESANDIRFAECTKRSVLAFYQSWRTFIRYYSTRHLTEKSDRLIALMGIIRVIEKQTGFRCVDGHWDDGSRQFVHELMWSPEEQVTLSVREKTEQSKLCSSWSWASLGSPVQPSKTGVKAWKDFNCSLQLQAIESKVLIPWASYPLKVSGMLRRSHKGIPGNSEGNNYLKVRYPNKRVFRVMSEALKEINGYVCFDCAGGEPEQFFLSPVHTYLTNSIEITCLVLVERLSDGNRARYFERVGLGVIPILASIPSRPGPGLDDRKYFEACERETYYII